MPLHRQVVAVSGNLSKLSGTILLCAFASREIGQRLEGKKKASSDFGCSYEHATIIIPVSKAQEEIWDDKQNSH